MSLQMTDDAADEFEFALLRAAEIAARDGLPPALRAAVASCGVPVSCVRIRHLLDSGLFSEDQIVSEFLLIASMATRH